MESSFIELKCTLDHPDIQAGVTAYEGCSISIFHPLLNSYRRPFRDEMNETIAEQRQFEDALNEQIMHPESHPLIRQINAWEKESIDKIQQRANELRQRLLQVITAHADQLSEKFGSLSRQIFAAERDENVIETDIHRWKQTLNDLKVNLASPSAIAINQYMNNLLAQDIYVFSIATNELFLQAFDNKVQIEEDDQLAIHDVQLEPIEIQGRNAYTTGCHKIPLLLEQSTNN